MTWTISPEVVVLTFTCYPWVSCKRLIFFKLNIVDILSGYLGWLSYKMKKSFQLLRWASNITIQKRKPGLLHYPVRKNSPPQNVSTWMCHLRLSGTTTIRAPISYTLHSLGANHWLLNKECHFFQLLTLFWAISFIIIPHTSVMMLSRTSHHKDSSFPWWCSRLPSIYTFERKSHSISSALGRQSPRAKPSLCFTASNSVFPCASGHKIYGARCEQMAGSLTQ